MMYLVIDSFEGSVIGVFTTLEQAVEVNGQFEDSGIVAIEPNKVVNEVLF